MEERLESRQISEDTVQQVLLLAERLRESHGKELDDESLVAVAEATGAPLDYVRIAVARRPEQQTQTVTKKLRGAYLSMGPEERAWITAGALGAGAGMAYALDQRFTHSNGLFGILTILLALAGVYAIATRKDSRTATIAGAILGGISVITASAFGLLIGTHSVGDPEVIIPITVAGALIGYFLRQILAKNRRAFGLKDPVEQRHEMIRQLHELRQKLESGKQDMTFLSVDMVGSTRMKSGADPLDVEFTFKEYHRFVEMVTVKYGGRVHSTAGDGVTCAFDSPQLAWQAARNLQMGIIELNTFRNKLGRPVVLRCGIHTGSVMAPDQRDVTSVNFAHVIDIAAHLQKVCPPGGIAVSQVAAIEITGGPSAIGEDRVEADGEIGYVWQPKSAFSPPAQESPPPFMPEQA